MPSLSAFDQSQRVTIGSRAAWPPRVPDDPGAVSPDLFGNPPVDWVGFLDWVGFPSRPESTAACRRLTRSVLRVWGLPQLGETAEQLASELVGNAVRHTGARAFALRMQRRRGWLRVEVRDPSRALPCLLPARGLDTSGRGLMLVDKLADRWGVDLLPHGKTTWFELRVPDR